MIAGHFHTNVIVHYWLLSFAVVLLWLPRQWLRFGKKVITLPSKKSGAAKNLRDSGDVSMRLREELPNARNWVDFLRAFAGGVGVCVVGFELPSGTPKDTIIYVYVIQCAVLAVAVFIQTARNFQHRITLVAPVFFIFGLSFSLIGWQAALFAFVTVWALNLLLPSAMTFLVVLSLLELAFGRFLSNGAPIKMVFLSAALTIGPVLLSAMMNRQLVKLNKKNRSRSSKT